MYLRNVSIREPYSHASERRPIQETSIGRRLPESTRRNALIQEAYTCASEMCPLKRHAPMTPFSTHSRNKSLREASFRGSLINIAFIWGKGDIGMANASILKAPGPDAIGGKCIHSEALQPCPRNVPIRETSIGLLLSESTFGNVSILQACTSASEMCPLQRRASLTFIPYTMAILCCCVVCWIFKRTCVANIPTISLLSIAGLLAHIN